MNYHSDAMRRYLARSLIFDNTKNIIFLIDLLTKMSFYGYLEEKNEKY